MDKTRRIPGIGRRHRSIASLSSGIVALFTTPILFHSIGRTAVE